MTKLIALVAALVSTLTGAFVFLRDHPDAGRFHVEAGQIIGPDQKPFVPIGMNVLGPDAFFDGEGDTAAQAEVLAKAWHANTVRVNMCLPEGCPYVDVDNKRNEDLDKIVDAFTKQKIVVIIAMHQVKPGAWPDDATLTKIEDFWHQTALRYGDNQRVWFNLLNEPGNEKPAAHRWVDVHERLLHAVRDAGAKNMVVVDGTSWGQETGGKATSTPVDDANSAILSFGRELQGDDDAVAFSFHVYDQWGDPNASDGQRVARIKDYIERVHAKGLAVLIGEAGSADSPCCQPKALATLAAYQAAPALGVGILAWHGQPVDDNLLWHWDADGNTPSSIDDWTNPTNLTWAGTLLWDYAHGRPLRYFAPKS